MKLNRQLAAWALTASLAAASMPLATAAPASIEMTWMSIANWYFKIGDKRIVMDGYISRLPQDLFTPAPTYPADKYTFSTKPAAVDQASIEKVHDAVLGKEKLDLLLVGHSHFDHSWDTPAWSRLSGAKMIGGISTCLQAQAQGVAPSDCRSVDGGEKIALGDGLTVHVVRWNHSGDKSNPVQHFARELYRAPEPDPKTGGLRAGVGEDYPNGGGGRAFLLTLERPDGKLSLFVNNSASAYDLDQDIVVDGVNYGSPIGNLAAAMKAAGITQVDAWIGTGGKPVAEKVVPVLRPKTYLPSHWDGLFNAFWAGLPYPYKDETLASYLKAQNVTLLPQRQYFDKFIVSAKGVRPEANHEMKSRLGFQDRQQFSQSLQAAVRQVATTVVGDDCGEGYRDTSAWMKALALAR